MSDFADHFSSHAEAYARHRPRYPAALFEALAERAAAAGPVRCAWDCATGNGQAAVALAAHFPTVEATDASAAQIAQAQPHPRVRYRVAPAEASGLPPASVQLITVAQAYHWFDADRFHAEAQRVLAPGGLLAVWCYTLAQITPAIDAEVAALYHETRPWWPPERAHLEAGYADLPWPYPPLEAPAVAMTADWHVEALLGYLGTWSGVRRYAADQGHDPVAARAATLRRLWGPGPRPVRWPVTLRLGRPG